VSPDGVDSECGQGLVGAEEEFIGRPAEERYKEQNNQLQ